MYQVLQISCFFLASFISFWFFVFRFFEIDCKSTFLDFARDLLETSLIRVAALSFWLSSSMIRAVQSFI